MPPRVRDVATIPALDLRVLAGGSGPGMERRVRWVASSELEDPGPYLEGGELLLTTGMRLAPDDGPGATGYVGRLVAAGVVALGFGVGPVHAGTPAALVAAADAAGLPLLEVPLPVPFIAVSKAVSGLLAAEEYEQAARGFAAQRDLIRAALDDDDPDQAVLARLVRHLGGFALLLDPAGAVVRARPVTAAGRAAELAGEVARLRPRGVLASAVVASAQEYVVLHPLGVPGRTHGFLAVGSPAAPSPGDHAVVNLAVSLLSLALARAESRHSAARGVRTAAMQLLLAGRGAVLPLTDLGWSRATGRVRVVVVSAGPSAVATGEDRVGDVLAQAAVASGVLPEDPALIVAVLSADAALDDLRDAVHLGDPLVAAGVGDTADADDADALARSLARARRALAAVGGGLRAYDDLGGGLDALLDPAAADAWAVALLAPLDRPGERADLAATLRAWLDRHGQVDAAAADLGVHRHTVRHRLRRAETLLGRSLDDPAVRAELYLALSRRPA